MKYIWNNEQSETIRMWKKYQIHAKRSEAENFLKKYIIRALKFIVLILKLYTGASKFGCHGKPGPPAPTPSVPLVKNICQIWAVLCLTRLWVKFYLKSYLPWSMSNVDLSELKTHLTSHKWNITKMFNNSYKNKSLNGFGFRWSRCLLISQSKFWTHKHFIHKQEFLPAKFCAKHLIQIQVACMFWFYCG